MIRLFKISVQPKTCNFFLGQLTRWICCLLSACDIWLVIVLLVDPRPTASKDKLWLRMQAIWNSLPQADIQNLFDSMPRLKAALIAARGGYTQY